MRSAHVFLRSNISVQPVLKLVDIFEESTEYERNWCLPFNSICLCAEENEKDPSQVELLETGKLLSHKKNSVYFTTCNTPMRIRYTRANLHCCIHFRYELFPGVDLFSAFHDRCEIDDAGLLRKIRMVFAESDPLRRIAAAESAVLETILKFWPGELPLDIVETAKFQKLFHYVNSNLNNRTGVPEMAAVMGWSEAYFARMFRKVFHITPKQYLLQELFARAVVMLNDPHKNIRQIADELQFSSEFNFSRFIRRYSGYPPSELKRNSAVLLNVRK